MASEFEKLWEYGAVHHDREKFDKLWDKASDKNRNKYRARLAKEIDEDMARRKRNREKRAQRKKSKLRKTITKKTGAKRSSSSSRSMGSAQASATAFIDGLRNRDNRARKALGLRSYTSRQAKNLMRRKSTGGSGG